MMEEPEQLGFVSPLGPIRLAWADGHCIRVWLEPRLEPGRPPTVPPAPADHPMRLWLTAWFAGQELPLPPLAAPATPFQARLRAALLAIPRGETRTYGELARALGSSPRAVGQALKANPLPLLIPCHRVVGAHGLGGFACGTDWKRKLLDFERNGATGP